MTDTTALEAKIEDYRRLAAAAVRKHWGLFLIEGIVLLGLGIAAIILPWLATLAVAIFIGWLFLVTGIVGIVSTFVMRGVPGFWWSLISGILAIVAGGLLIGWPFTGAISLTLVLIIFFFVEGFASILYALEHRKAASGRWVWMLVNGIVDLVLATIILVGFPFTAAWAVGLLVGIDMAIGGAALIGMALHARKEASSASAS